MVSGLLESTTYSTARVFPGSTTAKGMLGSLAGSFDFVIYSHSTDTLEPSVQGTRVLNCVPNIWATSKEKEGLAINSRGML